MTPPKRFTPEKHAPREETALPEPSPHGTPNILHAQDLFLGNKEVWIRHASEIYRLQLTRQNRLLLTK